MRAAEIDIRTQTPRQARERVVNSFDRRIDCLCESIKAFGRDRNLQGFDIAEVAIGRGM